MSPPLAAAAPSFEFEASWDYSDPAATEATFRAFLDATSEPANSEYVLQLQTQIARTLGLQGEFDRANSLLDTVQKGLSESSPVAQVRHLLERGRTLNSSGQAEAARPLFEKAWLSAQELGEDFHAVDAAHMVAIVADGDEALQWNAKALTLAEGSSDTRAGNWRGSLYNNIGWTHHDAGRFDAALELFQRGLEFRRAQGKERPIRIARWSVARTLRSLGRTEEALVQQEALYAELSSLSPPESDPYVREELAECLHALDRKAEAKPHFKAAWEQLSSDSWLAKHESKRLERLKNLAGD